MRILTAFKVFFAALFNREKAERLALLLEHSPESAASEKAVPEKKEQFPEKMEKKHPEKAVQQSEAITLLAALQREARLIDFFKENLDQYDDSQVGAAARTVHDQSAAVLERFFAMKPLRNEEESSMLEMTDSDAALIQFTGNVPETRPYRGRLTHHGWKATKCELPKWNGSNESAMVIAPAEIEIP